MTGQEAMRIAFLSANREQLPDPVVPLGLLYVQAATPARHPSEVWDLCFEARPLEALAERLAAFRPDLVAIGLRNIQNALYTGGGETLAGYRAVVETIRRRSAARIVLGGAGFSVMPRRLLDHLGVDLGISGEGERAFPRLLEALEAGADLSAVPNLHWRDGDRLVSNPPPGAFLELDALAPPDRTLLDPGYGRTSRIASVQTKRGCPLDCTYCTYPVIEGRRGRVRSAARVADELERVRRERPEVDHVFFVDSTFNLPTSHAKAVCRELIARGGTLPWTCYANPLGFDAELAALMAEAGCVGMEIGSDSGCDAVLTALRKGFDTAAIRRISALAQEAGLKDCHTFILGTPGETLQQVDETLAFIADLDPFSAILMVWRDDEDAIGDDPEQVAAREALRGAVLERIRERVAGFDRWVIPELGVRFDARLFKFLRHSRNLSGPLWQHVDRTMA